MAGCLDDVPADGAVRYSEHIERGGAAMVRHACRLGLEGIVSKRKDQPYRAGRGKHWLKTKCIAAPGIRDRRLRALDHLAQGGRLAGHGSVRGGRLVHVGRVGTGFTEAVARDLWTSPGGAQAADPPFAQKLPAEAARGVRWVEPKLVAEVELRGWTTDGLLRHASFKGLREDKDPSRGRAGGAARSCGKAALADDPDDSRLTHPDRVLWPDVGLTKQGLAEFYADIADWVLPHLVGPAVVARALPVRTAEGMLLPEARLGGHRIGRSAAARSSDEEVLFIGDLDGLIALVQASVLEIHPWGSTLGNLERPDRITIDLDPGEDVPWTALIDGASEVRERLRALRLESFVKTTGGKGLHVVVAADAEGRLGRR